MVCLGQCDSSVFCYLLDVSERGGCSVVLYLTTGPFILTLGGSQYQDVNPVSTSPLANYIAIAPSRLVGVTQFSSLQFN